MGLFGLSSFGEGLVKGLAEGATTSMQNEIKRIEDSIKSASDIRVTRIAQDQERKREDAEKVVKALRRAKAQLGGVDDKQAAIRAASLLKQSGDLDAFNSLVDQISQRTDFDYDKYFGDVSKMSPAASDLDIAYSFVEEGSIPMQQPTGAMEQIKPKGILSYLGPDIDAQKLVEERTQDQMQMMGFGVRDIRKIAVPVVEFREEAFKLDDMSADEEFNYVNDKIAKGNLTPEKMKFYSQRAEQLAGRLGYDEQLEIATEQLRVAQSAQDAAAIARAEQNILNIGQQKRKVDVLKTGNTLELLKLDKEIAIENKDFAKVQEINKQLLDAGAMTIEAYTSDLNVRALQGDEASKAELIKIGTFNANLKQKIGDATKRVTIDGIDSIDKSIRSRVMRMLSSDASLAAKGIQFKPDAYGQKSLDEASIIDDADKQAAFDNAYASAISAVYEEYAKNPDLMKDVNFVAAYTAHKEGIEITPSGDDTVGGFVPNPATVEAFAGYESPEELAKVIKDSTQEGKPININNTIATAKAAGKNEPYIKKLTELLGGQSSAVTTDTPAAEKPAVSSNVAKAAEALKSLPILAGEKSELKAIQDALGVSELEARQLLDAARTEMKRQNLAEKTAKQEAAEKEAGETYPPAIAKRLRNPKNIDDYNDALAAYMRVTGKSEADVKLSFPPPASAKSKGGLMSRGR